MVTLSGSGAQVAGEDYTLTCQFTGGEAVTPVYRWLKDGSLLAGETSDTLSFSPLRNTDSGGYTCEVTTGSLTGTSPSVTITVVSKCLYRFLSPSPWNNCSWPSVYSPEKENYAC